jgi:integrase
VSRPSSYTPLLLALWTGQRQGDLLLLRLTWKDYDGAYVRMRQSKGRGRKGRRRVTIPVGPPLKAALDAAPKEKRSAVTILVSSFGRPWTEDGFRTSWDKAFRKTSLKDLHFHDLRGTAVTRLALSNCSVPEIASITGHSMKTVQEILDAPTDDQTSASRVRVSCIAKLTIVEAATQPDFSAGRGLWCARRAVAFVVISMDCPIL